MDKVTASRVWVELNMGQKPVELKGTPLDTHEQIWAEMERVRPMASKSEVNRMWAEKFGLSEANIQFSFGHP